MKLSYVVLLSDDVPTAVRFWRDVVKLPMTYNDETLGYAAFSTGSEGMTIAIHGRQLLATLVGEASPVPVGRQTYLSFKVDDVDATFGDLVEGGAKAVAQPQDRPEMYTRNAYLSDPDGHVFEIYGNMSGS